MWMWMWDLVEGKVWGVEGKVWVGWGWDGGICHTGVWGCVDGMRG